MELFRLGTPGFANWGYPTEFIEEYSSAIWTERFLPAGDFQIVTPSIQKTMELIPEGSLISHLDTKEVMIVENHVVKRNEDGVRELTTTGQSFETFLRNRPIEGLRGKSWKLPQQYSAAEAAGVLIWDGIVYTDASDPIVSDIFAHNPDYALDGNVVTDSSTTVTAAPTAGWFVEPKDMYTYLINFLSAGNLGIRIIRPDSDGSKRLTYVNAGGGGAVTHQASIDGETNQRWDIYEGIDRPNTIFSYETGDMDEASYLFSIKNWFNQAFVLASTTAADDIYVSLDGVGSGTGIGAYRRTMVVDGELNQIDPNGNVMPLADYVAALEQKGLAALAKQRRDAMFDAAISVNSDYKYKVDYDLGDLVTVMGEYGLFETMRVSEHVRSEDESGEREFPTLVRIG